MVLSPELEALKWRKPLTANCTLRLIMRRLLLVALLVSVPLASNACLNDRDSDALAVQNNRFPDALRVISGRFERNPPRFYQMRIARVEAELKARPRDFGLYDDLAVAHDKLGDDESALKIMASKRAILPAYNAHDKTNTEAWYRFFANDGTFRAHRFLHNGAKVQNLGEMTRARNEIIRALQIKPNAHFGREKYQRAVMDWVIATKTKKTNAALDEFLDNRFDWEMDNSEATNGAMTEAAQGLSGLIVLGAAWRSPDVFHALARSLSSPQTVALSFLAQKRSEELLGHGVPSLNPAALNLETIESQKEMLQHIGLNPQNARTLDALYPKLRAEAENWSANRAKFMEAKFALGKHPDTDANFWNGWKDSAPPSLDVAWFNQTEEDNRTISTQIAELVGFVIGVFVLLIWLLRRRAKRTASVA